MREKSAGSFADDASADAYLAGLGLTKQSGTIYFNITSEAWKYWDGSAWQVFPYATVAPNSITFPKLDDTAYDWPKAFGAAEANDATTNDAAFAALEASALTGRTIDLGGKTYAVSAVPTGARYRNGYFRVTNFVGEADVAIPQAETILTAKLPLATGICNAHWPQHKWAVWGGGLYPMWTESTQHSLTSVGDGRGVMMRSLDGIHFTQREQFKPTSDSSSPWAASIIGGVWLMANREDSNNIFRLYARHLAQRFELTDKLRTRSGGSYVYIEMADLMKYPGAAFVEGQLVDFNVVTDVGGLSINGEFEVSYVNTNEVQFTQSGLGSASSDAVGGGTFEINISEAPPENYWTEISVDGMTLGAAINAASPEFTAAPVVIHGIAWAPGADGMAGTFYTGASGNGGNAAIVKVTKAFDKNGTSGGATVATVAEITGAHVQITEPTVYCLPDGRLCGFARTQEANDGQTVPAIFWTSEDDLASFTVWDLPLGAFEQSPIPVCQMGDRLVAVAHLQRAGDGEPGPREMVLLVADIEAAFAQGIDAFETIYIENANSTDQQLGGTGAGAGVGTPSIAAIDDKTVFLGYGEELEMRDPEREVNGVIQVAMKVGLGSANPLDYKGPARIAFGQVEGLGQWHGHVYGLPAVANGGYLTFEAIEQMSAPWSIDVSGADGYFTPPVSGLYEFSLQVAYGTGTAGEKYVQIVDEADAVVLNRYLAVAFAGSTTAPSSGNSQFSVYLRAGQKVRFKVVTADGTRDSVARSFLEVRRAI